MNLTLIRSVMMRNMQILTRNIATLVKDMFDPSNFSLVISSCFRVHLCWLKHLVTLSNKVGGDSFHFYQDHLQESLIFCLHPLGTNISKSAILQTKVWSCTSCFHWSTEGNSMQCGQVKNPKRGLIHKIVAPSCSLNSCDLVYIVFFAYE